MLLVTGAIRNADEDAEYLPLRMYLGRKENIYVWIGFKKKLMIGLARI